MRISDCGTVEPFRSGPPAATSRFPLHFQTIPSVPTASANPKLETRNLEPAGLPANVAAVPAKVGEPDRLNVVVVGHVDHGKSTFIGRLLFDTGSLKQGKLEQVRKACAAESMEFEYAFLLDALLEEQAQNITIDTTRIPFHTARREYAIIDAPGHAEFLKNMVTGASSASAAFLLIDAHEGIREQSKRHAFLLSLLGVRQLVVLVNKMDLAGFDEARFRRIVAEYTEFLDTLGLEPRHFIPIAARHGDNVAGRSARMPWYAGPTAVEALDGFTDTIDLSAKPLRFVVQDVYRWDGKRVFVGRVESGTLKEGDRIVFSPGGKTSTVARIERWSAPARKAAETGESVGITLVDQIFVERGHVATHEKDGAYEGQQFRARIFWIQQESLRPGQPLTLRLVTQETAAEVVSIEKVVDATTLSEVTRPVADAHVARHEVAEVTLRTKKPVAFDVTGVIASTSRFALYAGRAPSGGGVVLPAHYFQRGREGGIAENLFWSSGRITRQTREARNGHPGLVVWLTGLSGSGKSTIASELEKQLFGTGRQVYLLDGDNLRQGLSAGLGFSAADRTENIRRAGEVAKLLSDTGQIVITAFISPFAADRDRVRTLLPEGRFAEVYVNAPVEVCKTRDSKGLYARAERGEIKEFTGISSPYEPPTHPDLELRTDRISTDQAVEKLLEYLAPRIEYNRDPQI